MKMVWNPVIPARTPTASMADIAFLLIIFFMVTTVHEVDRSNIRLPLSIAREEANKDSAYVVLDKDDDTGQVLYKFSDGKAMSQAVGALSREIAPHLEAAQ